MAITIKAAGLAHGYSGHDHLITGRECEGVVGRTFRSVAEARRAAEREVAHEADRRVRVAPVEMEIRFASGETRWIK